MKAMLIRGASGNLVLVAVGITSGYASRQGDRAAAVLSGPDIYSVATGGSKPQMPNVSGIGLARGPGGKILSAGQPACGHERHQVGH
jgi:hypothetical protein